MQILSNVWPLRQVWDAQNPNFFFKKALGTTKASFILSLQKDVEMTLESGVLHQINSRPV